MVSGADRAEEHDNLGKLALGLEVAVFKWASGTIVLIKAPVLHKASEKCIGYCHESWYEEFTEG